MRTKSMIGMLGLWLACVGMISPVAHADEICKIFSPGSTDRKQCEAALDKTPRVSERDPRVNQSILKRIYAAILQASDEVPANSTVGIMR